MVGVSLSPFPGFRVCSPMDSQINRPEKRTPPALQVSVSLVSWMVLQRHLKSARDKIRSWRVSGVLGMLSERHVAILAAPLTHEAAPFSTNKGIFTAFNSCLYKECLDVLSSVSCFNWLLETWGLSSGCFIPLRSLLTHNPTCGGQLLSWCECCSSSALKISHPVPHLCGRAVHCQKWMVCKLHLGLEAGRWPVHSVSPRYIWDFRKS